MKTNQYKQHCWYDQKVISALKKFKPEDYDDPFSGEPFYNRENYRPMRIVLLDNSGTPCSPRNKMSFDICNDYPEDIVIAENYVNAVFGKLPNWTPATVGVLCDSLFVWVVRFRDGMKMVDFELIAIDQISTDIRIQIDIDAVDDFEAERYIIYSEPNAKDKESDTHFIVEEYRNSILRRTSEMGCDEHGVFELITENEAE